MRKVLKLPLHYIRPESDRKLYLSLGQGYRWNTFIFHFVYSANNLFKSLLIGFAIYSLDLKE